MQEWRTGRMQASREMIEAVLGLPAGVTITGVGLSLDNKVLTFRITGPGLPQVEGQDCPLYEMRVTRRVDVAVVPAEKQD